MNDSEDMNTDSQEDVRKSVSPVDDLTSYATARTRIASVSMMAVRGQSESGKIRVLIGRAGFLYRCLIRDVDWVGRGDLAN